MAKSNLILYQDKIQSIRYLYHIERIEYLYTAEDATGILLTIQNNYMEFIHVKNRKLIRYIQLDVNLPINYFIKNKLKADIFPSNCFENRKLFNDNAFSPNVQYITEKALKLQDMEAFI